jgi:hypothetical protein
VAVEVEAEAAACRAVQAVLRARTARIKNSRQVLDTGLIQSVAIPESPWIGRILFAYWMQTGMVMLQKNNGIVPSSSTI